MKSIRLITAMTFLTFTFTGCDKVEDLLEHDLAFSLDETIHIESVSADDETYLYAETINVNDDGNVSDNFDNIKEYEVEKLTLTVINLITGGSPSVKDMVLSLTHQSGSATIQITEVIDLAAFQTAGATDLDVSSDLLEKIKDMFTAGGDITLGAVATVQDGPAEFDITISIVGKITVAP